MQVGEHDVRDVGGIDTDGSEMRRKLAPADHSVKWAVGSYLLRAPPRVDQHEMVPRPDQEATQAVLDQPVLVEEVGVVEPILAAMARLGNRIFMDEVEVGGVF